jgi:hypothetical protein
MVQPGVDAGEGELALALALTLTATWAPTLTPTGAQTWTLTPTPTPTRARTWALRRPHDLPFLFDIDFGGSGLAISYFGLLVAAFFLSFSSRH